MKKNNIRLHDEVKTLLVRKETETPGDVLVLPINFGDLYAGFSAQNARWEALHHSQLPLNSVQVGCLLLSMSERLVTNDDLSIGCPGDEYNWKNDGQWFRCPCFTPKGGVSFGAGCSGLPSRSSGSAVAFL